MVKKFYAEIREYGTDITIRRVECTSQKIADAMANTFDINLDHESYYTVAFEEN